MDLRKLKAKRVAFVAACDNMIDDLKPTRFHPFVLVFPLALFGLLTMVFAAAYSVGTLVGLIASYLWRIVVSIFCAVLALAYVLTITIKYTWKAALKKGGRG